MSDDRRAAADSFERARASYAHGRLSEAERLCRAVLGREPAHPGALSLLGVTLAQMQRPQEAAELLGRAAAAVPDSADAQANHGNALRALGRYPDALACYERATGLKPDHAVAWNNRGAMLRLLGRHEEALASIDRAIALQPKLAAAHGNRGITLGLQGRLEDALESFDTVLALEPTHAAHAHRGDTLYALHRLEEALASYDGAIAAQPGYAEAHARRGATLTAMGRYVEALASYDRALAADPRCLNAHVNRGVTLHQLRRFPEALASLDQAIRLGRRDAHVHHCRGAVLQELDALEEAIASYERAVAIDPRTPFLRGNRRHARMLACDWDGFEGDRAAIASALERGEPAATPFVALSLLDSPALQRRAAEVWVREKLVRAGGPTAAPRHPRHDRIRVGYFSADLHHHALATLATGLFATHDRSRFELTAFSLRPAASAAPPSGIETAFDRFLQVDGQTDGEIAALARRLEIDIAVDLGGHTRSARAGIMALRAAPVQVSYLGYLGTLGAPFIDYLLADCVLVPPEAREHYSEKIAYLPSYQVNDRRRPESLRASTRGELGLPPSGFVFCCFNNTYKITPETFDSWMRIVVAVPGSVLFLLGSSAVAERNLRREAARRGVAPERLIFGRSLPQAQYLARYRAADLFLDTLPYNAGTTASDALWAGLPVLTLPGESFAARMAASVLTAAGLPELIARTRTDYERVAVELATDAPRLEALGRKLAANRGRCALFDAATFTRNLESLYRRMYERHLAELPAEHLLCNESGPPDGRAT